MAGKTNISKTNVLFLKNALALVRQARLTAVRQTNSLMVFTYFQLGRLIVENEQKGKSKAGYGKETLASLSAHLTKHFGKGFSIDNLENMRGFYLGFKHKLKEAPISETLSRKSIASQKAQKGSLQLRSAKSETVSRKSFVDVFPLSWSHYVLLCRIKDAGERNFYEIEALQNYWGVRELQRQLDTGLFERLALSKNKKQVQNLSKKGQVIEKAEDALKTPYILEFLGLETRSSYTENDLETAIISKIEHFLLEMGKGFLFGGRQVRFALDGDDYFVDLVLYNRLLQCFVLVDLKIGKIKHQDIGQMQMYVNYYDRYVKTEKEQPTIGIIICKDKSEAMVEITLPADNKTIFAKEYKIYLPSKAELKKLIKTS